MITISVVSFIPYLENVQREYKLSTPVTIEEFVLTLGIRWDDDALVVVNENIVTDRELELKDGDSVHLLLPLSGG
ncbi:MAG: MoaD/ThiS family protein [Bacillus sp. (in: Bacteria)]|nr:MoaD/ThiS family protein [Bacillus sp. (in: firmicutes)]